ncbi:MAG: sulfur oxidation c-type cytochrome SoxA [Burkholderiales bacterium]|nr:sulfur oxidation c-type cytochrome SoxA [Burkholderiales bacterium]
MLIRQPFPASWICNITRLFAWLVALSALQSLAQPPGKVQPKSGLDYASADVRALQADDFANPGMLWVARGEKLWNAPAGRSAASCASCHREAPASMKGVAARYPRFDRGAGKVLNLEARINRCRETRQQAEPLQYEAEDLLALTAYVAHQSRGQPLAPAADADSAAARERGREQYFRRQGQMNLACTHCHDRLAGRKLLSDTISEGHGNGYPAYRLEWQTLGSLQRRLRACFTGVRAETPAFAAPELIELELYLAQRAGPLRVETPAVRR